MPFAGDVSKWKYWCAAGLFVWVTQLLAAPDEMARIEIDYLLTRLESSGCEFFRNGRWYEAARARKHLE